MRGITDWIMSASCLLIGYRLRLSVQPRPDVFELEQLLVQLLALLEQLPRCAELTCLAQVMASLQLFEKPAGCVNMQQKPLGDFEDAPVSWPLSAAGSPKWPLACPAW